MHIPLFEKIMRLPAIKRQSLLSFFFTVAITAAGFCSTILFSNILGKDLMGVYYLFLTYYSIFNLVGDGGFGNAAIKRISEGRDKNEYFSAYVFLRALLVIASTVILIGLSPLFVDLAEYNIVPIIIITLIVSFIAGAITCGIRGLDHVGVYSTANGISEIFRILLSVTLVLVGFSVYGMIGGFVAGLLLSGVLCVKYLKFKPARFSSYHIRTLLTFSFWGFLISGANLIMMYADTLFIGYFMENGDVGIYRVALQFTSISLFAMSAVNITLIPKISNLSANNQTFKIPPMVARAFTYGLILAIPAAVGGILLSKELMGFFYGADFAFGATAAYIIFIFQIITVFLTIAGTALTNSDHVRNTFYATFVAVILNVVLDIILIPVMGINGAAVGSLIAIFVNTVIVIAQLKRFMPVYAEKKPILHIVIASGVMGLFVFVYKIIIPLDNIVLTLIPVAFGVLIYVFVLFKLDKGIREDVRGVLANFGLIK